MIQFLNVFKISLEFDFVTKSLVLIIKPLHYVGIMI